MTQVTKILFALFVLVGGYLLIIQMAKPAPETKHEVVSHPYNATPTVIENPPKAGDRNSARLSYFDHLIETSPNDKSTMRLKSTPTEREIEEHAGPPTERHVAKSSDTPAQYVTEFDPVTYVSWEDQNSSFVCEFSHKDGRLFGLSITNKLGLSISGVGRTWGTFHTTN